MRSKLLSGTIEDIAEQANDEFYDERSTLPSPEIRSREFRPLAAKERGEVNKRVSPTLV
jgi:hypothetical protein